MVEPGYACTGQPSGCASVCGDGGRVAPEECDDGNLAAGDGCASNCTVEQGFICSGGTPQLRDFCFPTCGDGLRVLEDLGMLGGRLWGSSVEGRWGAGKLARGSKWRRLPRLASQGSEIEQYRYRRRQLTPKFGSAASTAAGWANLRPHTWLLLRLRRSSASLEGEGGGSKRARARDSRLAARPSARSSRRSVPRAPSDVQIRPHSIERCGWTNVRPNPSSGMPVQAKFWGPSWRVRQAFHVRSVVGRCVGAGVGLGLCHVGPGSGLVSAPGSGSASVPDSTPCVAPPTPL